MTKLFEQAIAYTLWADDHIAQVVRQATQTDPALLTAPQPLALKSILETIVHLMAAQKAWLLRLEGNSPTRLVDSTDYPDLDSLAVEWTRVHQAWVTFVANEIDPERLVTYKTTTGVEYTHPLGLLVWHMVNHSTEHRAQLAAMTTAAGHSPGDIDLLYYLRHKSSYATGSVV